MTTPEQPALRAVDVQRWDFPARQGAESLEHDPNGEWVKHADHAQALAAAGREIARLTALEKDRERIRLEVIGHMAKHGICMLVDSDPTAPGEIAMAIGTLARERDDARKEAGRYKGALEKVALYDCTDGGVGCCGCAPCRAREALEDGRGEGDSANTKETT